MFAVLQASAATPIDALVGVAQAFTPRFQVLGPFVVLDIGGLSALFGTPGELGGAIREACPACRSMALASTASTALLLACGREGLTVLSREEEQAALAALPIDVLVEVTEARLAATMPVTPAAPPGTSGSAGPGTGTGASTPAAMLSPSMGWRHPRDTHQAQHARRLRPRPSPPADMREALRALRQCAVTVHRWGIRRLGALAALPRADVHARLGELGVSWQRLAAGEDDEPLVPWLAEPVFEELVELEWPIEGFEPLSFVLARLLEPLATRLERADRGAVAIRTALHLTSRQVHVRVIPLPAPMRDPKTLRTLVLLDLESHPPSIACRCGWSPRRAACCSGRSSIARSRRPSRWRRSWRGSPRSSARGMWARLRWWTPGGRGPSGWSRFGWGDRGERPCTQHPCTLHPCTLHPSSPSLSAASACRSRCASAWTMAARCG